MKMFAKFLMAGAVAVVAIAVSAAPSEAAKRHHMKKMAVGVPAGVCVPGAACTGLPNPLQEGRGTVYMCGGDAKWVAHLSPGCMGPGCPAPCL
jgi:hypothetical protein